ncbi:hypothetical protein J2X12_002862 [Pseudarthrobacter oxydans]|uniref:Uncharacterized protein n=1 Tax=Pseudarthrobacter oxydans TaxID=1671 RepID=A0AAW8NE13_PSEOX|nr:hypothetical protein [Pseudarthrobacter oxydans]MDR6794851.1 hypothetical protein [Pseudarthrobacter oxydans]MDR7164824.1 hypothetical protein [Pseudarthrobacter oxydans]
MALAAKDVKPGMAVAVDGQPGQWEVLDRHPRHNHWWLHRRGASGEWQTTFDHMRHLHRVADGSRHEYEQTELEAA